MMRANFVRIVLSLTISMFVGTVLAATSGDTGNTSAGTKSPAVDLRGTWTGAFQPRNHDVPPFTVTISIDQDEHGKLVGKLSHDSSCLEDAALEVTMEGSKVSLAGSDSRGNSVTFHGKLDRTATLLNTNYIMNGSATGKCESDGGTGTLGKQ